MFTVGVGLAVGCTAMNASADGLSDFYQQLAQQRYFNHPVSPRSLGMGGVTTVTHDSSNVLSNPAGLGWMQDAEVSVAYGRDYVSGNDINNFQEIQQDLDSGYAVGAFPIAPTIDGLPEWGNVGFGWSGWRSDVDDTVNIETDGYRIHAAYAKAINPQWSFGYSATYSDNTQETDIGSIEADDGWKHTIGAQWKPDRAWTFGATFFNGQSDADYNTQTLAGQPVSFTLDQDSFGGDIGFGYEWDEQTLLVGQIDYVSYDSEGGLNGQSFNEDGESWGFRTGIEHAFTDDFRGRAGYRYQANLDYDFDAAPELNGTAKFNAVSAGIGWDIGDFLRLDYGTEYRWIADGDWSHWVSASFPFSICVEDYES